MNVKYWCRYQHELIFSSAHSGNGVVLMNGKQDNCILKILQVSKLLGSELCELPALILILLSGSCDHSQPESAFRMLSYDFIVSNDLL